MSRIEVYFGGPDLPAGRLRDVLEERIHAVPAGGAIDWVTYYFRDRRLARALVDAQRRGVDVRVSIDGRPRTPHASDRARAVLANLGDRFRTVCLSPREGRWHPHLHEKLYCFSHPVPQALVGSFNPSGDIPELDPDVLADIGDQDRAHNYLVAYRDPVLVRGLQAHARWLHGTRVPGTLGSLLPANRTLRRGRTRIHFLPCAAHPAARLLRRVGPRARVRIAASHMKGAEVRALLRKLARSGAALDVIAEPSLRRVSRRIEHTMRELQIPFRRLVDRYGLPMHNKFVLVEEGQRRVAIFGSFNWTSRSWHFNREICVLSEEDDVFAAFDQRWQAMIRSAHEREA